MYLSFPSPNLSSCTARRQNGVVSVWLPFPKSQTDTTDGRNDRGSLARELLKEVFLESSPFSVSLLFCLSDSLLCLIDYFDVGIEFRSPSKRRKLLM